MNVLKDVTFGHKFSIVGLTLIVAAAAVIESAYSALSDLAASSNRGWQRVTAAAYTSEAKDLSDMVGAAITEHILQEKTPSTSTTLAALQQEFSQLAEKIPAILQKAENSLTEEDQERFVAAHATLKPTLTSFLQTCDELLTLLATGQKAEARAAQPRLVSVFTQLGREMAALNSVMAREAFALQERTRQEVATTQHIFIYGAALGIAVILLVLIWITRSITMPLAVLNQAARRIAVGDVHQRVEYVSGDEIGALASSFRDLIQYLQEMARAAETISKGDLTVDITSHSEQDVLAHSFQRMVGNLRAIAGKVQEGAQVVAAAISQILASTGELAASVTETATSVSQTATTVEEVKQTAYVSSQKANDISTGAQQTASVSQTGEQAVEKTVARMANIREKMESISQSVVRLGEQSQVIEEIITSVGQVAEQSNLLAVNAAIEAAKAGTHGKGFAVVAREVKTLAEQSKQATEHVRTILSEIQKSAHVAVLVTEQGVKSIETGVQQSLEAGESIRLLTRNITEAANAVTQIAASSQQQLVGMDQVGVAMKSIKYASEQNATGMRQIQNAAHDLHRVGQTLTELVGQFTVTEQPND